MTSLANWWTSNRFSPRAIALLLAALALLSAGCAAPLPHRGDGTFKDLSGFIGPTYIRGYSIRMPEFDLAEAHEAEYQVSQLRDIGYDCKVFLAIDASTRVGEYQDDVDGYLDLELRDSQDNVVMSVQGRLGDFIWACGGDYKLYQLDKSSFSPDPREDYTLRISYSPDARLNGLKGAVLLRSGGGK